MKYFLIESPYRNEKQALSQKLVCNELIRSVTCVDSPKQADVIVPVGGDGTMLHAIRAHYELNKPFVGINAGTRGFLMNNLSDGETVVNLLEEEIRYQTLWMIEARIETESGTETIYGFNDIWVERTEGQTLRMFLQIDDKPPSAMIVGDGMLFCTPQGSTGYNLALRGKVILPGVPVLQVTPMAAVLNKSPLGSIILSENSRITLTFDKLSTRPGRIMMDGIVCGIKDFKKLIISKSALTIELGFKKDADFISKMGAWQIR